MDVQEDSSRKELDVEDVRDLFELLHTRERHIVDRMWESQKHFTTLYTALITVTIALVSWFTQTQRISPPKALVAIPLTAITLLAIGFLDFYRERRADLEVVASLAKIERYLGLHTAIDEKKRYFPQDKYLIPDPYAENKRFKSSAAFIKHFLGLKKQVKQWQTQTVLLPYIILSSIAIALAIAILLL